MTLEQAEFKGWQDAVDAVRASLEGYPEHGGDIVIMQQVDRLRLDVARRCAEIVSALDCADCGHGSDDGLSCLENAVVEILREFHIDGAERRDKIPCAI